MSGELFRPDHGPIRPNCRKLAEGAMLLRGFASAKAPSIVRCEKLVWAGIYRVSPITASRRSPTVIIR